MHSRRLAAALTTAGLATVALSGVTHDAAAVPRTFQVKLVTGATITVTLDLPPGVTPSSIPGVNVGIVSITEITPQPSAPPVQVDPGLTTPQQPAQPQAPAQPSEQQQSGPTAEEQTGQAPAQQQPSPASADDAEAARGSGQPKQNDEPKAKAGGGQAQATTGDVLRGLVPEVGGGAGAARGGDRDGDGRRDRAGDGAAAQGAGTAMREPDGTPAISNPALSLATPGPAAIGVPNFFIDKFRIPPFLLSIYQAAGIEYGIRWEVLAAINEIETDYGRNLNVSSAGALGWMQFMPATWKQYGVDANGDRRKDPYNPVDAIFAAARYLKAAGAEEDLRRAIFAYNHADWYVDSVLMRARLIGGLPADLVGSLTGLTQGMFPVHASARYADDLSEKEAVKRVSRGRNAALPVESSTERRGISIFAKAGSPAVAVQDGEVVKLGTTKRLGRFVKLRDVYGNTYTYAHLGSVADHHLVPKERTVSRAAVAKELDLPKDPKPKAAASAGKQPAKAKAKAKTKVAAVAPAPAPKVAKERLFAAPQRPAAFRAGGRDQLLDTDGVAPDSALSKYLVRDLGIDRDQLRLRRLKVGSKVIGGTILGRIGTPASGAAPHLLFEIRPAGRGAPRIDPKPILDGWKLLESTAIYRAKGKNPFFGRDAAPSIGQILLMAKPELERRVLKNPRIEIYGCGMRDIEASRIDRRVLATLELLAASGLRPTVTSLQCGHSLMTASGNVSHHSTGSAVDIAKINGIPILGHQGKGSITDIAVRRLLTLQGTMKPAQIITLMEYEGTDNTLAMSDHNDHIHVGFTPQFDPRSKVGRQVDALLKPGQWIKLIDRLGKIDNPTVRVKPSKAAIAVGPDRGSTAHRGE